MKFRHYKALSVAPNAGTNVDRAAGIIRNVSIISTGAAKGHGVSCDDKTLDTVLACIKTYKTGLKVKFNARTFNHGDGAILGLVPIESCRIEDGQVIGDLHIEKDYPWPEEVKYIYSLAEKQADTFGLSIDFTGIAEDIGGIEYMRCEEIYAVTVVDEPAANASGMFSATEDAPDKQNKPNAHMPLDENDKKEIKAMLTEAVAPLSQKIGDIETKVNADAKEDETENTKEKTPPEGEMPTTDGMSDEEIKDEEMAAGVTDKDGALSAARKVKAYRARLAKMSPGQIVALAVKGTLQAFSKAGGRAIHGIGGGSDTKNGEGKLTGFAARVAALVEAGGIAEGDAILALRKKYPKEYGEYRSEKQNSMRRPANA